LPDFSASSVVQAAKQQFARHGIPVWVHSDGGSQFAAREFSVFSHAWGFEHTLSSPYNSQSNGKAESEVKIAKKLWKRSKYPYLALILLELLLF
jgi:transposase InsO family protein